ncbi:MAG: hypothetical protein ACYTG5_16700 [Planctomycetota bacterium]|jgi:hypothetical protein
MAEKKGSPAFNFVVEQLKQAPGLSFAEVKTAAAESGLKIYPILYGRAKALLGLVPVAPRGSKKAAKKQAKPAAKQEASSEGAADTPLESLSAVIEAMKACEQQRESYRQALKEIAEIIKRVL